jgi:type II restriction enzyme
MEKLTASNLVKLINQLNKKQGFDYISPKNRGLIKINSIDLPEGPIRILRWNPSKNEVADDSRIESISTELIWRVANAFRPNIPVNLDRVLGGSYNTRSVLEALLAHCPEFYYCYPGRIETIGHKTRIKKGHKHLIWKPGESHPTGRIAQAETDIVVSEVPPTDVFYDSIRLSESPEGASLPIEIQRRHAQIQVALVCVGLQLEFRSWIASNDRGIIYQNRRLEEHDGVIQSLSEEKLLSAFPDAVNAALFIDCMWFKNSKLMPAVMEIEHSTGVTSGLTRMNNFRNHFPPFPTRYAIVAPDELREKVFTEANKEQFRELKTKFFPYSAVEELFSLCQRRKLRGVTEEFLDCFMENTIS